MDFGALFDSDNPQTAHDDAGDDVLLNELGLAWAACYAQEEASGPAINQGLAT